MVWKNSFKRTNGYIDLIGSMHSTTTVLVGRQHRWQIPFLLGGGVIELAYGACMTVFIKAVRVIAYNG